MPLDYRNVALAALSHIHKLVPAWLPCGKRQGKYWLALNPKRQDHRYGSFRVNLQTGQWGDFAVGAIGGDLVSLKAYLLGVSQHKACELLAVEIGHLPPVPPVSPFSKKERWVVAASIWAESIPLTRNCLGMDYLRGRGLDMEILPQNLRFHGNLRERVTGKKFPALVAKVSNREGSLRGIHRIFLSHTGTKAPVPDPKQMLGEVAGGAVRLAEAQDVLAVAEGIETALAVQELFGIPAWATLSTSGMRLVQLPDTLRTVYVAVDYDANGAGEAAGTALVHRMREEGRKAEILHPRRFIGMLPEGSKGVDWLDILTMQGETSHAA